MPPMIVCFGKAGIASATPPLPATMDMPLFFSLGSDILVALIFFGLLFYLHRVSRSRALWGAVQYGAGHLLYSIGSMESELSDGYLDGLHSTEVWLVALSAAMLINFGAAMMLHGISRLFDYRLPGRWHKLPDVIAALITGVPILLYGSYHSMLNATDLTQAMLVLSMAVFMLFVRDPPYRNPAMAVAIACLILLVLYIIEPLLERTGVIEVWLSHYGAWATLDLSLWMTTNYCLLMLASFRAMRAFERGARMDPLTDILNRLGFENAYGRLRETLRADSPLAVITLDLDHFKLINDRWMHEGGDAVLRAFSRAVEKCLRSTDVFARFGGEEFVVLLPGATRDVALRVAETLRIRIESMRIPFGETEIAVTTSIGVAMGLLGDDRRQLLAASDVAVYAAKQRGRNRVVFADEIPPESPTRKRDRGTPAQRA